MYKIFVTFIVAMLIGASIQQGPSGQFGLGGNQESSGSVAGSGIGSLIPGGPGVNGSFGLGGNEGLNGNTSLGGSHRSMYICKNRRNHGEIALRHKSRAFIQNVQK
ncbi:hypothetical protein SFRURICE_014430 [Spodoptera frugiperda]|nr:hypothetical protein SFRURICE_014430 [Spodoptera frugiperda]